MAEIVPKLMKAPLELFVGNICSLNFQSWMAIKNTTSINAALCNLTRKASTFNVADEDIARNKKGKSYNACLTCRGAMKDYKSNAVATQRQSRT